MPQQLQLPLPLLLQHPLFLVLEETMVPTSLQLAAVAAASLEQLWVVHLLLVASVLLPSRVLQARVLLPSAPRTLLLRQHQRQRH